MIREWSLTYDNFNPEEEKLREALCTLGNGYFAVRGAAEESNAGEFHYPGTYLHGGYNRLESEVSGKVIENEDLVNWPNWLCLTFRIEDGKWFDLHEVVIENYHQELDLKQGILIRKITFRDEDNRKTTLHSERIVSMADKNLAAIYWTLEAHNWSGHITVRSALDANVQNDGVPRYRSLNGQHLELLEKRPWGEDGVCLLVQTNQSQIRMAQASRLRVCRQLDQSPVELDRSTWEESNQIGQDLKFWIERHHPVCLHKFVAIYTSRDPAISEPLLAARIKLQRIEKFSTLRQNHELAWKHLWGRGDIRIKGDGEAQHILRLHIFHVFQTASPHTIHIDAGMPARGLHGEAYRGHIFWDEVFIFPYLNYCVPDITRSLLLYRYRRLDEARHAAREIGCAGAMFPWQSGSSGREETQVIHLNPRSGNWLPDNTHLQRHINAAIAYNIWQYYQATEDWEFMHFQGAEMFLEIARFWASVATYSKEKEKYEILGVVGPDEYHTEYPGSDQPGLNNNAYTNFMAAWVLYIAQRIIQLVNERRKMELLEILDMPEDEIQHWDTISRNMFIRFIRDVVISQFEGYENLKELDLEPYREKFGDNLRLDRILESQGDSPNRYKVSKQADLLMLFYLFSAEAIEEVFERLNYSFDRTCITDNIEYYVNRTAHGSTLSRIVFSWVWSRDNRQESWYHFEEALISDLRDIQGGTTPEGIHLGAMAGTIDLVQRCYTGLEVRDDVLWLNPILPHGIKGLEFKIRYRGHELSIDLEEERMEVTFDDAVWSQKIRIGINGQIQSIQKGQTRVFDLTPA